MFLSWWQRRQHPYLYTFIKRINVFIGERIHDDNKRVWIAAVENELSFRLSNHGAKFSRGSCMEDEFTFNLVHFGLKTIFVGVLSIRTVASDCHASVEAIYNISICQLHLANFNAHHGPMHDMASTLDECSRCYTNELNNRTSTIILIIRTFLLYNCITRYVYWVLTVSFLLFSRIIIITLWKVKLNVRLNH